MVVLRFMVVLGTGSDSTGSEGAGVIYCFGVPRQAKGSSRASRRHAGKMVHGRVEQMLYNSREREGGTV